MNTNEKVLTAALAAFSLLLFVAPASAGPLSSHPSAYNDGFGPSGGAWTSSTAYNDGFSFLVGTVDWAVFTAADFNTAFPASGYTPPAGQLVYAYQMLNTGGIVAATGLTIGITSGIPVGTIGSFSGAGVSGDVPTGIQFTGVPTDSANFTFTGVSAGGGTSEGLAFSSPNVPENGFGAVADSGVNAVVIPLPTPSATPIPEPATTIMACLGMVVLLARGRSRK